MCNSHTVASFCINSPCAKLNFLRFKTRLLSHIGIALARFSDTSFRYGLQLILWDMQGRNDFTWILILLPTVKEAMHLYEFKLEPSLTEM